MPGREPHLGGGVTDEPAVEEHAGAGRARHPEKARDVPPGEGRVEDELAGAGQVEVAMRAARTLPPRRRPPAGPEASRTGSGERGRPDDHVSHEHARAGDVRGDGQRRDALPHALDSCVERSDARELLRRGDLLEREQVVERLGELAERLVSATEVVEDRRLVAGVVRLLVGVERSLVAERESSPRRPHA